MVFTQEQFINDLKIKMKKMNERIIFLEGQRNYIEELIYDLENYITIKEED